MYVTHDHIEEIECSVCQGMVPYYNIYEVKDALKHIRLVCEYCIDEMYQPETI